MTSAPRPRLFHEGHALIVGVGTYADPSWNAPTAENDARTLYATLVDPELSAYPRDQVELLTGAQATRAGILDALGRLARRSGPDSRALIVFTCHGDRGGQGSDRKYYLAAHDTDFSGGQIVGASGLSALEVARALRDVPARGLLLVLNACFSGAAGQPGAGEGGPGSVLPEDQATLMIASGEGRAIITASRPDQRSFFRTDAPHSFFGQALIDGLRGSGAPDSGGYIGLYELYNLLHHQTTRAAAELGRAQEPVLTMLQVTGAFPVARYPGSPAAGDSRALADRPSVEAAGGVRSLPPSVFQNVGPGGAVLGPVGDDANVRVSSGLITFGDNVQAGNITIGDVAGHDIIKSTVNYGSGGGQEAEADPVAELPRVAARLATARNVDEENRDLAALKLRYAHKAYLEGDRNKAGARLDEALALMRAMGNGFVDSLARKVEAARAAL